MSGVAIKAAGKNFSKFVRSLTLVDRSSLLAEYHLGGTNTTAIVNHANAAAPMTVVGTPTHSTYYTTCTTTTPGDNNFDMNMPAPNSDMTMMALVRKRTSFTSIMSGGSPSTGLVNLGAIPSFYNTESGTATSVANLPLPATSDFFLIVGVGALGQKGKLYIYEGGVQSVNTAPSNGPTSRGTLTNLFLGYGVGGQIDIAWAALYGRALASSELDTDYAALKAFFTDRGLIVS